MALRAVYAGEAEPYQQRLALSVIVNKFSRAQEMLYIPDSQDQTAFINGRAAVGQKVLKYVKLPVGQLQEYIDESEEKDDG